MSLSPTRPTSSKPPLLLGPRVKETFVNNIEVWFSLAGLAVIWMMPALFSGSAINPWQVAALTATFVGVFHGGIFWTVRRKQRRVRSRAIWEIREMLEDVVKNQLAVIGMYLPSAKENPQLAIELEGIKESIESISQLVDSLSEESVDQWKTRYKEAVETIEGIQGAPMAA